MLTPFCYGTLAQTQAAFKNCTPELLEQTTGNSSRAAVHNMVSVPCARPSSFFKTEHANYPRFITGLFIFFALEIGLILFLDKPISIAIHTFDQSYKWLPQFFNSFTSIGLGIFWITPSGLLAIMGLTLWYMSKSIKLRNAGRELAFKAGYFFATASSAGICVNILKYIFGRARPKLLAQQDIYTFDPFGFTAGAWLSFPSGHSSTIFAVAMATTILAPALRLPAFVLAVSVALSRIMINAHYFSDVLAGALLGVFCACLMAKLFLNKLKPILYPVN